jgi:hypothetical protein
VQQVEGVLTLDQAVLRQQGVGVEQNDLEIGENGQIVVDFDYQRANL